MDFFANNQKGWPVGSTKNRTTLDVSLPAAAIAAVAKAGEAQKKMSRMRNDRQRSAAQTITMLKKKSTLKESVCDILLNSDIAFKRHGIPESTLKDHSVKFESVADLIDFLLGDVTREQCVGAISKLLPPLLYMDDVTFL